MGPWAPGPGPGPMGPWPLVVYYYIITPLFYIIILFYILFIYFIYYLYMLYAILYILYIILYVLLYFMVFYSKIYIFGHNLIKIPHFTVFLYIIALTPIAPWAGIWYKHV